MWRSEGDCIQHCNAAHSIRYICSGVLLQSGSAYSDHNPLTVSICVAGDVVGVYSNGTEGAVLLLTGMGGGVTHITFSADGNLLFVGFRKV